MASSTKGSRSAWRQIRRDAVIRALQRDGAQSRRDLMASTGLSRSTISEIVASLLADGLVETQVAAAPGGRGGRGRPVELIRVSDINRKYWLGVEFSHSRAHAVVLCGDREVVAQGVARYPTASEWPERFEAAWHLLEEELDLSVPISGAGIGFPSSAVMRGHDLIWRGQQGALDLVSSAAQRIGEHWDCVVSVDNNVRLAGLAEIAWLTPNQPANQVYLRISDGIGAAIVVGGQLLTGESGFGGEVGHITVHSDGELCRCGKRGCLETVASGAAIIRRCQQAGLSVQSIDDVAEFYRSGHRAVIEIVADACREIGRMLGNVAVLTDPAQIVLAGTVVAAFPHLVDVVREEVGRALLPVNEVIPATLRSRLGDDAGAIGAALMARSAKDSRYPLLQPQGV